MIFRNQYDNQKPVILNIYIKFENFLICFLVIIFYAYMSKIDLKEMYLIIYSYKFNNIFISLTMSSPASTPAKKVRATKKADLTLIHPEELPNQSEPKAKKDKASKPKTDKASKPKTDKAKTSKKAESDDSKDVPDKKKTLPAKYKKFIQFSYFLMMQLNKDEQLISQDKFFELAHIYDDIDQQMTFVDSFFNDKNINKSIKSTSPEVLAKLAKKEAKLQAKQQAKLDKIAEKNAAKDAKRQAKLLKKTNNKKNDLPSDDIVADLVSIANNKQSNIDIHLNHDHNHNHDHDDNLNHDDDDELLEVELLTLNSPVNQINQCLVDKLGNAYHTNDHTLIGKINDNNLILF